jgi:hypothetical protein
VAAGVSGKLPSETITKLYNVASEIQLTDKDLVVLPRQATLETGTNNFAQTFER